MGDRECLPEFRLNYELLYAFGGGVELGSMHNL